MAIASPIFQSSMELLGHAVTHFNGTSELDRKLLILHLSNSVELLLKDMVLDTGQSIYKGPKETITIHGCIEALKSQSIEIPLLNKLELLIDERNALQHRFGSPNELTAIFYMTVAQEFFRSILKQHYGQDFDELLIQFSERKDLAALKLREPSNDSELESLKKLGKVHPLGALLSATTYIEQTLIKFVERVGLRKPLNVSMLVSPSFLESNGIELQIPMRNKLNKVRQVKNSVAHGKADATYEDVVSTIATAEELERVLSEMDIESTIRSVEMARKRREEERENMEHRVLMSAEKSIYQTVLTYLQRDSSLGNRKFTIDASDGSIVLSVFPEGAGKVDIRHYPYNINEDGNNLAEEARRIRSAIRRDFGEPS